jgi:hypothetical protein
MSKLRQLRERDLITVKAHQVIIHHPDGISWQGTTAATSITTIPRKITLGYPPALLGLAPRGITILRY